MGQQKNANYWITIICIFSLENTGTFIPMPSGNSCAGSLFLSPKALIISPAEYLERVFVSFSGLNHH
jgi:hypothetical protein